MLQKTIMESFYLLFSFDNELSIIVFTTLKIVLASILIASLISVPLAISISFMKETPKKFLTAIFNSLLAVPTVVIGLFVYMLISNAGPFGEYKLLFTPFAIVIGQTILAIPIITSFILAGFSKTDILMQETIKTLGAGTIEMVKTIAVEHKALILSSILAGFGRVIAEVGISMMLGGNIRFYTRTITTAIALETGKGEFALGLALGIILITIAILVNFFAHYSIKNSSNLRAA
ncbi:MAG: ABC transporter permease [Cyanobacteriota bacterium]